MPEDVDAESSYQPNTALGRKLLVIRLKIITPDEPLLSWEEIEQEIKERRGSPG